MAETNKPEDFVRHEYEAGFVTDIEADTFEPGLDDDVIRRLSEIKGEPDWMLEWRLEAYRKFQEMTEPNWQKVSFDPVDLHSISYYSAPKKDSDRPQSLDEVDPELLRTYEKARHPAARTESPRGCGRRRAPAETEAESGGGGAYSNVAVDAVFDSVSVVTTFKGKARRSRRHLLLHLGSPPRASGTGEEIPGLRGATWRQLFRLPELRGLQ